MYKIKVNTVKGILKLLNDIRQMKMSYKLYIAIKMSYIILQNITILALRKPNILRLRYKIGKLYNYHFFNKGIHNTLPEASFSRIFQILNRPQLTYLFNL